MNRPRVLLAEDHLIIREEVTRLLESEFDIIDGVMECAFRWRMNDGVTEEFA